MSLETVLQLGSFGLLAYCIIKFGIPFLETQRAMVRRMDALTIVLCRKEGMTWAEVQDLMKTTDRSSVGAGDKS